mgnify:CR=1 FL=1
MPARIAATDPFKPIGEYVGSGPMRFVRNEWARTAEDVLWRRTKCGLHMSAAERDNFAGWMQRNVSLS